MPQPEEMQFSSQVFGGVYCSSFNCRKPAKYAIGRCIGPASLKMNVCEQCAQDLVKNIPPELQKFRPSDPLAVNIEVSPEELVQYAVLGPPLESAVPTVFTCEKCGATFLAYMAKQAHQKNCKGGGI